MNDIQFKYGNVDHLVLRPDGRVFLVETKSYRGRVTWDGRDLLLNGKPFRQNYLCQVNRNIRWLKRISRSIFGKSDWIAAIIVFPYAEVRIGRAVKRVRVLNARDLVDFIQSFPLK